MTTKKNSVQLSW